MAEEREKEEGEGGRERWWKDDEDRMYKEQEKNTNIQSCSFTIWEPRRRISHCITKIPSYEGSISATRPSDAMGGQYWDHPVYHTYPVMLWTGNTGIIQCTIHIQ